MKPDNPYDERYADEGFYWGKSPSSLCDSVIELAGKEQRRRLTLIDLGCGEGRDVVYFARHGFDVVGLDASAPGLEKTRRYAAEAGVDVRTVHADVLTCELDETYDVVFSTGTLHYLPPEIREERFRHFKRATAPNGLHAVTVFVEKPFIPRAPDAEPAAHPFRSGELFGYYWDWEIVYCTEEIFDCRSSGVPHKHACNRVIAKRA